MTKKGPNPAPSRVGSPAPKAAQVRCRPAPSDRFAIFACETCGASRIYGQAPADPNCSFTRRALIHCAACTRLAWHTFVGTSAAPGPAASVRAPVKATAVAR